MVVTRVRLPAYVGVVSGSGRVHDCGPIFGLANIDPGRLEPALLAPTTIASSLKPQNRTLTSRPLNLLGLGKKGRGARQKKTEPPDLTLMNPTCCQLRDVAYKKSELSYRCIRPLPLAGIEPMTLRLGSACIIN